MGEIKKNYDDLVDLYTRGEPLLGNYVLIFSDLLDNFKNYLINKCFFDNNNNQQEQWRIIFCNSYKI